MSGTSLYNVKRICAYATSRILGLVHELLEENIYVLCAGSTLKAFWFGAIGTIMGAVVAFGAVGHFLGPNGWKIASSLCASYVGGSVNYAATAQVLLISKSVC
jgi:uncharacterized membrane protein